jgi:death-on-curing protein
MDIHRAVLEDTPLEPPDLLDSGKLESALAQPRQQFGGEYLHDDLFMMAAAYCFHLAKAHAFLSANKRVAALAATTFLKLNRHSVKVDQEAYADLILSRLAGRAGKDELAEFFRASRDVT